MFYACTRRPSSGRHIVNGPIPAPAGREGWGFGFPSASQDMFPVPHGIGTLLCEQIDTHDWKHYLPSYYVRWGGGGVKMISIPRIWDEQIHYDCCNVLFLINCIWQAAQRDHLPQLFFEIKLALIWSLGGIRHARLHEEYICLVYSPN